MRRILFIAGLLACTSAFATTNLPMTCNSAAVAAACPGDSWTTAPGADGKYVAVSGKGVIDWKDASAIDLVRVCPSDITAGTACPVARISVAKTLAASAVVAPPETTRVVTFTWSAPNTDTNGGALPASDITGYSLSWNYAVGGDVNNVALEANAVTYTTQVQTKRLCAMVTVLAKGGQNSTAELCKDPPTLAKVPSAPSNFNFN